MAGRMASLRMVALREGSATHSHFEMYGESVTEVVRSRRCGAQRAVPRKEDGHASGKRRYVPRTPGLQNRRCGHTGAQNVVSGLTVHAGTLRWRGGVALADAREGGVRGDSTARQNRPF